MFIENTNIEYRDEFLDQIKKTIVAFANTSGGKIYIGVKSSGEVVGIKDINSTILRIKNTVKVDISPDLHLYIEIQRQSIENKDILQINIKKGSNSPYYITSKGLTYEGVYIRKGSADVHAEPHEIVHMIKNSSKTNYEDEISINQKLSFNEIQDFCKKINIDFNKKLMINLKLLNNVDMYTNLGLLASDQCPFSIKLTIFQGSQKEIINERKEFKGSVVTQLKETYQYIVDIIDEEQNILFKELPYDETKDISIYPNTVIWESLLNAIIHRDYDFKESILINKNSDKVEIINIGGLIRGISQSDIALGISVLRNKNLANLFYELGIIEAYGVGIPKVFDSYKKYNLEPTFILTENAFRITLPNTKPLSNASDSDYETAFSETEHYIMNVMKKIGD